MHLGDGQITTECIVIGNSVASGILAMALARWSDVKKGVRWILRRASGDPW